MAIDRGQGISQSALVANTSYPMAYAVETGVLATAYHFTGDGSTVAFTITGGVTDIPNDQSLIITIDGVTQHTDTYTTSGAIVTFTTAPPDNSDIQIRYNAYLGTATDASGITYSQGGTGASSRTVENKLQEFVSVKDFGATGDGVTDDTTAIQAAIDYCKANNVGLSFEGGKTYVISSTLEWVGSDISIGSTSGTRFTIAPSSAVKAFDLQGQSDTPTASTTVASTLASNDLTFDVASATGIVVGQIVELKSDTAWYYDDRGTTFKGETHRVASISSTTITIEGSIVDAYTIPTETVTAKFYNPAVLTISNMNVEYAELWALYIRFS